MSESGHWGRGEPVTISPRPAQRVRQAICSCLVHRKKPMPVVDPGLRPKRSKKEGPQEGKEQHKQRVLDEHSLGKGPPLGVQRVWRMHPNMKG